MEQLYDNCYRGSLDKGLDIIVEKRPKRPLSLGVWARVGSRHDPEGKSGISHFIEHLLFKGTNNRSAFQISEEIDALGGNINGLTHKEYTLLYVNVLSQHLEKALDVVSDLIINPLFKSSDIEKERGVVLQEIKENEDNPQDRIFDLFAQKFWTDHHPLSRPVMGETENMVRLTKEDILKHFKLYNHQNLILVVVGDVDLANLEKLVSEKFKDLKGPAEGRFSPISSPNTKPSFYAEEKEILQTHLCLGFEGISMADKKRFPLEALNAIFGSGMSSRLFRKIREKLGLAYSIFSHTSYYTDTGLVRIYSGTDEDKVKKVVDIILEEAREFNHQPVNQSTLKIAKEKLKGNFILGMEGSFSRMMRLGISAVYKRKLISVDEVINRIEQIKPSEIKQAAGDIFRNPTLVLIGPKKSDLLKLESIIEN